MNNARTSFITAGVALVSLLCGCERAAREQAFPEQSPATQAAAAQAPATQTRPAPDSRRAEPEIRVEVSRIVDDGVSATVYGRLVNDGRETIRLENEQLLLALIHVELKGPAATYRPNSPTIMADFLSPGRGYHKELRPGTPVEFEMPLLEGHSFLPQMSALRSRPAAYELRWTATLYSGSVPAGKVLLRGSGRCPYEVVGDGQGAGQEVRDRRERDEGGEEEIPLPPPTRPSDSV